MVPVSPNIFYAFLQVIVLSLRNVEIVRSARQLQEQLASLERGFGLFHSRFQDVGRAIDRASEAYRVGSGHVDRYKVRLDGALKLEALQEQAPAALNTETRAPQDE